MPEAKWVMDPIPVSLMFLFSSKPIHSLYTECGCASIQYIKHFLTPRFRHRAVPKGKRNNVYWVWTLDIVGIQCSPFPSTHPSIQSTHAQNVSGLCWMKFVAVFVFIKSENVDFSLHRRAVLGCFAVVFVPNIKLTNEQSHVYAFTANHPRLPLNGAFFYWFFPFIFIFVRSLCLAAYSIEIFNTFPWNY